MLAGKFALILISLSILAYMSSQVAFTNTSREQPWIIDIIPSTYVGVKSVARDSFLWNPIVIGNAILDANAYGLQGGLEGFTGQVDLCIDGKGILRLKTDLDLSSLELSPWSVVAYPEVMYGVKPWSPQYRHEKSSMLKLPEKLAKLPSIYISLDYAVAYSTTGMNLALDAWILKTIEPKEPGPGDVELMIWFYRTNSAGFPSPAGIPVKTFETDAIVDGSLSKIKVEMWSQSSIKRGWRYVAFLIDSSPARREIVLDFNWFLNALLNYFNIDPETYYLHSIELGFEIFYSERIIVEASVYKYQLIITSRERSLASLISISPRSKRAVAWITPWGLPFNETEFNPYFTPGIIVPYDVNCVLCTSELVNWFNKSMRIIDFFLSRKGVVFINLFCEEYHPSWRWRGQLSKVSLPREVIEALKTAIGDGERVYIGFSEMTSCVNDNECFDQLVNLYLVLRDMFPGARLYYYGTRGDGLENLLKLYEKAELDLVGIDVWEYSYDEGRVGIAGETLGLLAELSRSLRPDQLIIGEIGLRLNDKEAFIEPWDKRIRQHTPGIHREYYEQVLEELRAAGLVKGFVGIWAWNDDSFSIMLDQKLQESILAKTLEPEPPIDSTIVNPEPATLNHILLPVALGVSLLTFTIMFIKHRRRRHF